VRQLGPLSAIVASSTVLLAAGCGGGDGSDQKPRVGTGAVEVFDFGFRPNDDIVKPGTTVKWTNTGKLIHTVKQFPGSKERFFSRALESGTTYSRRFDEPGRYPYFCTLHPTRMRGAIIVR
jgi:plastocyanin